MHEHEAKKSGLSAKMQPHSVGHNTELTCNVAQAAPSVIDTTYLALKSRHRVTTLCMPRQCSPFPGGASQTWRTGRPAQHHIVSQPHIFLENALFSIT